MINSDFKCIAPNNESKPITRKQLNKILLKDFKKFLNDKSLDINVTYSIQEPVASFDFRSKL